MPYPRAYLYVLGLLLLTVPAFWPSYFSQVTEAPWQIHVHGISATLWMVLLIAQSWAIHHGRRGLHRSAGKLSFILAPIVLAGGMLVIGATMASGGPFREMFGARLVPADLLATITFAGFVLGALWCRRDIGLHASFMLATPFLLAGPVLSRLLTIIVPGLQIRAIEDLPNFATALHISQALAIGLALWLYLRNRGKGQPFAIAALVLALQNISFETYARTAWWREFAGGFADIPDALLAAIGFGTGLGVVYLGWTRPHLGFKAKRVAGA